MPPKLDKDGPTGRINVTAPESLVQQVEDWRARQRPIPSMAKAVRILIEKALTAEASMAGKDKG